MARSLSELLHARCGTFQPGYRRQASPRIIREDMEDMQEEFKDYADCYSKTASDWDAQGYADALAHYPQQVAALESQYQLDLSDRHQPRSVDGEVTQMRDTLDRQAEALRKKLEEGPNRIELLYASGRFQRPSSGPSTMQILAQTLNTMNQQLARQNAQSQQQLNALIQSVTVPTVNVPKVSTPQVETPAVNVQVASGTSTSTSRDAGFSSFGSVSSGVAERFGCYAAALQVCLEYEMPSNELQAYRQRCGAQGNAVLARCDIGAPSCKHSNFAGSVTTFNYDRSEAETTRQQCVASGGVFQP